LSIRLARTSREPSAHLVADVRPAFLGGFHAGGGALLMASRSDSALHPGRVQQPPKPRIGQVDRAATRRACSVDADASSMRVLQAWYLRGGLLRRAVI